MGKFTVNFVRAHKIYNTSSCDKINFFLQFFSIPPYKIKENQGDRPRRQKHTEGVREIEKNENKGRGTQVKLNELSQKHIP